MANNAPLVSHLNGICLLGTDIHRHTKVSPLLAQSRQAQVVIAGSVGKGGLNRKDDVRKIQDALNHIFGTDGGTQETPLVTDGICGHFTLGAIQTFQDVQFGRGRIANGLIERNAPTLNRINELFLENTVDPVRLPSLFNFIERADTAIGAALSNLTLAQPFLDPSGPASRVAFARALRIRLLNRHFDMDHQPSKQRALEEIRKIYALMREAMIGKGDSPSRQAPGVGGANIFVIDPIPRHELGASTAYTFPGGFHQPNVFNRDFEGLSHGSIYICAKFDEAFDERKVRVIIHELAHFVGKPSDIDGITDHGYGLVEDPRMRRLTPRQRILNADTYANFALEAANGRDLTRWI